MDFQRLRFFPTSNLKTNTVIVVKVVMPDDTIEDIEVNSTIDRDGDIWELRVKVRDAFVSRGLMTTENSPQQVYLLYNNKQLPRSGTLYSHGIDNGKTLTAYESISIKVEGSTGQMRSVKIVLDKCGNNVELLRTQIKQDFGLENYFYLLTDSGECLPHDGKLSDHWIQNKEISLKIKEYIKVSVVTLDKRVIPFRVYPNENGDGANFLRESIAKLRHDLNPDSFSLICCGKHICTGDSLFERGVRDGSTIHATMRDKRLSMVRVDEHILKMHSLDEGISHSMEMSEGATALNLSHSMETN